MSKPKLRFKEFNSEWKNEKLSELSSIIDGDRGKNYPKENDFFDNEYCLFLNAGNVTKQGFNFNNKLFITKEKDELLRNGKLIRNDIVLTTRGTVGNVVLYDNVIPYDNVRINSGMVIIRNNDSVIPKYLYSYMKSQMFENQVSKTNFGSAQPQLTIKGLEKFSISYPDKNEQVKVSNFLSLLDKKIELQSKKIEDLKLFKKGLYNELFKEVEGTDYLLSDIALFENGKGHENIVDENGKYILINSKFISTEGAIIKKCSEQLTPLYKNDITMVMSDLPNGKALAKCYYIDEDEKYSLNQRICRIQIKDNNKINSKYLFYLLNRNLYYLKFDDGVNQTNLKKEDILNIPLVIPSIEKQEKDSSILSIIDNLIDKESNKLSKLDLFKKGLMQNMFV